MWATSGSSDEMLKLELGGVVVVEFARGGGMGGEYLLYILLYLVH